MSHQILHAAQLLERVPGDGELHPVTLSSERFDEGRFQRNVTGLESFEKRWIQAHCASSLNAAVGRVLGQVQHLRAVGEKRGVAFSEV